MVQFIDVPIETDPDALADEALEYLAGVIPGFNPAEGNTETWLLRAKARIAADVRDVAADVPAAIFRKFGTDLVELPAIENAPATVTSTWTMADNLGHVIPAGTVVLIAAGADTEYAFQVAAEVEVPASSTTTADGEVVLEQILEEGEGGANANGLTAAPTLVDSLAYVSAIALEDSAGLATSTADGLDAEDDAAYLDRLRRRLRLMTPRPILPWHFSELAKDIATVYRALTLDGYNPNTLTDNNERTVTVVPILESGLAVTAATKTALATYLEGLREANWDVFTMDPSYTTIDVTYEAVMLDGYVAADVTADALAALGAFLSAATWGMPTEGEEPEWHDRPVVRYIEVGAVLESVPGIDYVVSLSVDGGAAGVNVTMTGRAPLPVLGTVTANVHV